MSGRKETTVPVPDWGDRDAGKLFHIKEWPAARAEAWATRMLALLLGTDERIPDEVLGMGMVGLARLGLNVFMRAQIDPEKLIPLMNELLECVQIIRDQQRPEIATAIVSDDDIEEVQTRLWLRSEVLRLHTGFSPGDFLSKLLAEALRTSPDS